MPLPGYPDRVRGFVILAILGLALGACDASLGGPQTGTSLRITYWEDSAKPAASVTWTLQCGPPRGTLSQPARACMRLVSVGTKAFAPTQTGTACTQIYGGPQKARVVGIVGGTRVWATFARADGCQIARWNRISPWLVPAGSVT
jgi:Subtilisin inhibitor-like